MMNNFISFLDLIGSFGDKEKDIEAEDQYIRDENGNILFQKTDMTPTQV